MKKQLWLIGLLTLGFLGCQDNSKTAKESTPTAKELRSNNRITGRTSYA
jgi:hypothetical protein